MDKNFGVVGRATLRYPATADTVLTEIGELVDVWSDDEAPKILSEVAERVRDFQDRGPLRTADLDDIMSPSALGGIPDDGEEKLSESLRKLFSHVWKNAYRSGVDDERDATELQVSNGVGGFYGPARTDPFALRMSGGAR